MVGSIFIAEALRSRIIFGNREGYVPGEHGLNPGEVFDLGITKSMSPEALRTMKTKEINNGRLAMIGIFGFLAESKIPGSVPALSGLIKPYAGEYMAPFTSDAMAAIYQ